MSTEPSTEAIESALRAAGEAHHDYESNFLDGNRDEQWAGWYGAYVLGRLGDFVSATSLARWLAETPSEGDWASAAAWNVNERVGS